MQSRLPEPSLWDGAQELGDRGKSKTEFGSRQPLVTPLPDPELALSRERLVTDLFKHVEEIQEIDDGYAFRFDLSEHMIRRIAGYIVFEGQNSPQLTFTIVEEPCARAF